MDEQRISKHQIENNWNLREREHDTSAEHVEDFYMVGSQLGKGGCGSVYAGFHIDDGVRVALKYVDRWVGDDLLLPGLEDGTPKEVGLMTLVDGHPNILICYEWFDESDYYIMALERPDHCMDLCRFCESQNGFLDENQAREIMVQLLQALLHCQQCRVFHRDVKPANILIDTETQRVILIDFGCGDLWQDTPYTTFAGTKEFAPPELFTQGMYEAGPATVWSLGVTLFCLVCGYLPFRRYDERSMSKVRFPEWLSLDVTDFISWCLEPIVEDRATLEELQVHFWLRPSSPEQVGFMVEERECQEEEQESMQEENLHLSITLIPAVECEEDGEEKSMQEEILDLPNSSPGVIVKREGECEGDGEEKLDCSNSLIPAKYPENNQDRNRLQVSVPGERMPPDPGRVRRAARCPSTQPEQTEDEQRPRQAQLGPFSPLWPFHCCHPTAQESSCLPVSQPQDRMLGYSGKGDGQNPGYDQWDATHGLAVDLQDPGPNLAAELIK